VEMCLVRKQQNSVIIGEPPFWMNSSATKVLCSPGITGPPGCGSLRWDSKVWLWILSDSDHWVITMQIAPHKHKTANFRL
jgi:hypothetical protein